MTLQKNSPLNNAQHKSAVATTRIVGLRLTAVIAVTATFVMNAPSATPPLKTAGAPSVLSAGMEPPASENTRHSSTDRTPPTTAQ